MSKQKQLNKRLFNKLFAEMSGVRKLKQPISIANNIKLKSSLRYLYYSKKTKMWFGFGETDYKYIYFFGIHEKHITLLNTLENSIMVDFDKKNNINENSIGILTDDLNVYLNKKIFEEKYPTFNPTQFQEHIIQYFNNGLKSELNTIELGELNTNFIDNLNKLIKNTPLNPVIKKTKYNNIEIDSMNLFLNSIKSGKSYEESLKLSKLDHSTIKNWYKKGRNNNKKYLNFYETYKKIMPKNQLIARKMNIILDSRKTGKNESESLNISNTSPSELNEWIEKGKNSEPEYLDFYEDYKKFQNVNSSELKNNPNKELIKKYIKLINEGKTNKEAFETLNIPRFKVKNWKKQGQLGNKEYKEFYDTYLKAVNREEFNKINLFIDLINQGKSNDEAINIIRMPKFKVKQWFNKGKNGDKDYLDFYNAYMKQYGESNNKIELPKENIKPLLKKDTTTKEKEKTCEICGRTINKKSTKNICKRCLRKQRCANIVQELLSSVEPNVPFKKDDLKKLGLKGMQIQDYIWTLQEFSLIKKEKNNKFSLISKDKIDEFIKESGVEIIDPKKTTVKLTKKCETCGQTLEISKFPVSENTQDGYEDNCKSCKKLITSANYLKELLNYVKYDEEFSEKKLEKYYPNPFLLQAKIWSLLENDLLIKNEETNNYILTKQEKCEEFIKKYFKELPKTTITSKSSTKTTSPKTTTSKPTTQKPIKTKKQKQMDTVLEAMKNGKTRKEAAKTAEISLYKITHWYKEGRDGFGEDNIFFFKSLKKIEEQQLNQLKTNFKTVLKVLKSGGSKSKAAKEASIDESEIDLWIKKGNNNIKPYDTFKKKYDKIHKKSIDYTDKHNIKARKLFIENIKNGKKRKESAEKASIDLKLLDSWIIRGTKGEHPFNEFYKEYREARNIAKEKPSSQEAQIKKEFIELLKEGYSHGEAARKIQNGDYAIKIKKWHTAGRQGVKKHLKFYLECQEAKNKSKTNKNKIFTLIADGFTIQETCEKLNLNPAKLKEEILKGKKGIKPYDELYIKIIESKISLIDLNQLFNSPNHPHKTQMIDFLDLLLIGTNEKEALKTANVDEATFKYWIKRGKRGLGELYTEFFQIYNKIKSGTLINDFKKNIEKQIEKELSEIEYDDGDILKLLPKDTRLKLNKLFGESETGFAWVNKIGNHWTYSRIINRENVELADTNIYELHKKVMNNNLMWGVRDFNKAKKTLNQSPKPNHNRSKDEDILKPLSKNIKTKFSKGTSTGFAWVSKSGNYFYYTRNNKNIRLKDSNLKNLHQQVIDNNLDWGVIDIKKAKKTLYEKNDNIPKSEPINRDILAPLPDYIEKELQRYSKGSKTGFAWVGKSGKKYSYERVINGEFISIREFTIEELHRKVINRNLTWGVRDLEKAKQTLAEKVDSPDIQPKKIPEVINNDILAPLPDNFEKELSKYSKGSKTGFAWVNKMGNFWKYSRRINDKTFEIKDENIYKLHEKVINQNLTWGVRNLEKAKITLAIKSAQYGNILKPIQNKEILKYSYTKTGFALVDKKENEWEYMRPYNGVKIKDKSIFGLFKKIVDKNLYWGVTDIDKARKTLEIDELPEKTSSDNSNNEIDQYDNLYNEILKPLPESINKKLSELSKGTSTGFAWVIKTGRYYIYKKRVDGKIIAIKDLNIIELYNKVKMQNLLWGVRDLKKAEKTLKKSYKKKIKEYPEEIINTNILAPLPQEHENLFKNTLISDSGIAWVSKIGNSWVYSRRVKGEPITIKDEDIYKLHEKVTNQNLTWGVRDLEKAKHAINGKNISDGEPSNSILKQLPLEIEQKLRKNSKGNLSGFAWVSKIGDKWQYSRVINGNTIHLKDPDIYKLHEIVIKNNYLWGVRDLTKAKKTLKECKKELPKPPKIDKLPNHTIQKSFDEEITSQNEDFDETDILAPLPRKYLKSFRKSKTSETGIAWVKKMGDKWLYSRRINGEYISISDEDIYKLHEKVLSKHLTWGVIDSVKAKEIIFNAQPTTNATIKNIPKETSNVFVTTHGDIISINGKIKNNEVLKVLTKIYEYGENILKMNTQQDNNETTLSIELKLNPTEKLEFENKIKEFGWEID